MARDGAVVIGVATAEQTRALDRMAIEDWGLPGTSLMEVASLEVARRVRVGTQCNARVVVVTGGGNNGGDGWGVARWLHAWGREVAVWSLKDPTDGDARTLFDVASALGIERADSVQGADLIVDAVFGTGLSREVEGRFADAIRAMNRASAPVWAVDLPSGLDADTGEVLGCAVKAARTLTFAVVKAALLSADGAAHAGEWEVVDIGLGAAVRSATLLGHLPEARDIAPLWPQRDRADHKTRSGDLLVVAGSRRMAGAAVLTCRAALAAGAGLVTLATPSDALVRLAALPPEVMVQPLGEDTVAGITDVERSRYTAIAAGPGLGTLDSATQAALRALWRTEDVPMVYDADAIACCSGQGRSQRVLTPHPGEAARFLGGTVQRVQSDRARAARSLSDGTRVALLKGPYTVVAQAGQPLSYNPTGSSVLATGGSGDVLTGVIGALLARGLSAWDAARVGAFVHGRAGELLGEEREEGWTAGDVADAIPRVVAELRERL